MCACPSPKNVAKSIKRAMETRDEGVEVIMECDGVLSKRGDKLSEEGRVSAREREVWRKISPRYIPAEACRVQQREL